MIRKNYWSRYSCPGFIFIGHRDGERWVQRDSLRADVAARHDRAYAAVLADDESVAAGAEPNLAARVAFLDALDAVAAAAWPLPDSPAWRDCANKAAPAIGVSDDELRRRGELAALARMVPTTHRAADEPEPIDQIKLRDGRVLDLRRVPKEAREHVQSAIGRLHAAVTLDEIESAKRLVEEAIRNAELAGSYNNAVLNEAEAPAQTAAEVQAVRAAESSRPTHADLFYPMTRRAPPRAREAYRP
jgi:hypothetical protein